MKTTTLTLLLAGISSLSFSQSNTLSSGGNASGGSGSISYSVGQVDYMNASGAGASYNQGVQQPYEFYFFNSVSELYHNLIIKLGPNPSNNEITIYSENLEVQNLKVFLSDLNGKIIIQDIPLLEETTIKISGLCAGQYLVNIEKENTLIKSYKLIKNQ
jgi:hypothetical protein